MVLLRDRRKRNSTMQALEFLNNVNSNRRNSEPQPATRPWPNKRRRTRRATDIFDIPLSPERDMRHAENGNGTADNTVEPLTPRRSTRLKELHNNTPKSQSRRSLRSNSDAREGIPDNEDGEDRENGHISQNRSFSSVSHPEDRYSPGSSSFVDEENENEGEDESFVSPSFLFIPRNISSGLRSNRASNANTLRINGSTRKIARERSEVQMSEALPASKGQESSASDHSPSNQDRSIRSSIVHETPKRRADENLHASPPSRQHRSESSRPSFHQASSRRHANTPTISRVRDEHEAQSPRLFSRPPEREQSGSAVPRSSRSMNGDDDEDAGVGTHAPSQPQSGHMHGVSPSFRRRTRATEKANQQSNIQEHTRSANTHTDSPVHEDSKRKQAQSNQNQMQSTRANSGSRYSLRERHTAEKSTRSSAAAGRDSPRERHTAEISIRSPSAAEEESNEEAHLPSSPRSGRNADADIMNGGGNEVTVNAQINRQPEGADVVLITVSGEESIDLTVNEAYEEEEDAVAWFENNLDVEKDTWIALIRRTRMMAATADPYMAKYFKGIKSLTSELHHIYQNLPEDPPLSLFDEGRNLVDGISGEASGILRKAWHLATSHHTSLSRKAKARYLVDEFEAHVLPDLVGLAVSYFKISYTNSLLVAARHPNLLHLLNVILSLCDQIFNLVKEEYVRSKAASGRIRRPLRLIIKALEQGDFGRSTQRHVDLDDSPDSVCEVASGRRWTDDEGIALTEGLRMYQGKLRVF